jgi:excisionase family DNA binding protein
MLDQTTAGDTPADTALPPKMITVKACAALLGVSDDTVHRRLTAKKLRGKKISARLTLIYADSVTEFLASCPDR